MKDGGNDGNESQIHDASAAAAATTTRHGDHTNSTHSNQNSHESSVANSPALVRRYQHPSYNHERRYSHGSSSLLVDKTNTVSMSLSSLSNAGQQASSSSSRMIQTHHLLVGLTVAGVASTLLTTVFSLFHVEVFLNAYELPLASYSRGSFIFSIINTVNDLVGAWIVDQSSATRTTSADRSDMVGFAGCVFALCFLTPFFRWKHAPHSSYYDSNNGELVWTTNSVPRWQDTFHFVMTMSLYDTLYSFTAILMGSVITDDHTMPESKRVQFMASGKVFNLVASFVVARIGLAIFNVENLYRFRVFVVVIAVVATILFLTAHCLMHGLPPSLQSYIPHPILRKWILGGTDKRLKTTRGYNSTVPTTSTTITTTSGHHASNNHYATLSSSSQQSHSHEDTTNPDDPNQHYIRRLQWKRVVMDFWKHRNFHRWIVMEMLLEAQVTFAAFFLKTFVDGLVVLPEETDDGSSSSGGLSRESCDWFLALVRPLKQIATIFAYIPIRRYGYYRIYAVLFVVNFVLAAIMFLFFTPQSSWAILIFLTLYSVLTGAVQSSGFHLAMADMVLEMKRIHAAEGRMVEPSLAGLFMGTNALFCKPAESVLPVIAASVLDGGGGGDNANSSFSFGMTITNNTQQQSFFYLLVGPPLICSVLQFLAWQNFNLTPSRTALMRAELLSLHHHKQPAEGAV